MADKIGKFCAAIKGTGYLDSGISLMKKVCERIDGAKWGLGDACEIDGKAISAKDCPSGSYATHLQVRSDLNRNCQCFIYYILS